jgi:hypothetical protein
VARVSRQHRLQVVQPGDDHERAVRLQHLISIRPTPGISDSVHHIYITTTATHAGVPEDKIEAEKIAWVPLSDISVMIGKAEITTGTTVASLLYASCSRHCKKVS